MTKHWLLVGCTRRNHSSDETLTTGRMLPTGIMVTTKHWLLVGCTMRNHVRDETLTTGRTYPQESCQWRNTDYWLDVTLGNHVSDETLTISRMLPLGIMSVKKLVRCFSLSIFHLFKKDKAQAKQTYEVFSYKMSNVTLGHHARDEILTTGRILPSGIMSVKKHWLLFGCYPRESCQWRN